MSQTTQTAAPKEPSRAPLILGGWLALSILFAMSGLVNRVRAAVPLSIAVAVVAGVLAYAFAPRFRAWTSRIPLSSLVALHGVRALIGALFLVEFRAGQLPELFAWRAGVGDIAAGLLALLVAHALPPGLRRISTLAWNLMGLLDILLVVATAQYLFFITKDPLMVSALSRFPYPVLPTFVVPLVILGHLLVFARLSNQDASPRERR